MFPLQRQSLEDISDRISCCLEHQNSGSEARLTCSRKGSTPEQVDVKIKHINCGIFIGALDLKKQTNNRIVQHNDLM